MFDCRCLPNPGKFEEYQVLTGLDTSVQEWLEAKEETAMFLNHVKGTLELSVKRYITQDFERLMVSCGCTGGQHRSVYVAEKLHKHFAGYLGLSVQLTHIEQSLWPTSTQVQER